MRRIYIFVFLCLVLSDTQIKCVFAESTGWGKVGARVRSAAEGVEGQGALDVLDADLDRFGF